VKCLTGARRARAGALSGTRGVMTKHYFYLFVTGLAWQEEATPSNPLF